MEIVYRNFMNLMAAGSFNADRHVEPMSRFKWRQVLRLADTYGVSHYVSAGIVGIAEKAQAPIPKDILETARATCHARRVPINRYTEAFNPSKTDTPKFANALLNRRLRKIVYNEIHSIDTSTATLALLYLIIDNINGIIHGRINYRQEIALGLYLRSNGDKIDFVKAEQWLRTLGIRRPANLVGSYLIVLFGFTEDEVPFVAKVDRNAAKEGVKPLRHTLTIAAKEPDFRDYDEKMGDRLNIPDTRILGRLRCFPAEVACKFVTGVCQSLSNIEE